MEASCEPLPPYVCVILHEEATGTLLLEQRPDDAAKAAGQLTCFGGTREDGEGAAACAVRECAEELGWAPPAASLRRAVDLYVDGALIAWFYEAAAPARDAPLRFEEGRSGVWLDVHSAIDHPKLSSWHECVLRAWRRAVPAGLVRGRVLGKVWPLREACWMRRQEAPGHRIMAPGGSLYKARGSTSPAGSWWSSWLPAAWQPR